MNYNTALAKARGPIESTFTDVCNVKEYRNVLNVATHVSEKSLVTLYSTQACRLTYKSNPVVGNGNAPTLFVSIKLLLPYNLSLSAGQFFEVTKDGNTQIFESGGEPARYQTHQEVMLTLIDKYA